MTKKKHYSEQIIDAFMNYDKIEDIAKVTGKHTQTITRYRDDPELQKELTRRRTILVKGALSTMQRELGKTVSKLIEIRDNPDTPKQTVVNACQIILSQTVKWTEATEILERIQALEDVQGKAM